MAFSKEKYGEWSVIMGASMGIGAACAREIASRGVNTVLVARSADKLARLATEIEAQYGVEARAVTLDLLEPDAYGKLDAELAGLNVGSAVYSAAYAHVGGFLACPEDLEERIMSLNVHGSLAFSKYFGKRFCQQKSGGMIMLGSLSGYFSTPYMALYSATKGFEVKLCESLWAEFKHLNVDVLCAIIGSVDTPGLQGLYPDPEAYAAMKPADPAIIAKATVDALGEGPVVFTTKEDKRNVSMLRKFMSYEKQVVTVGDATVKTSFKGKTPAQFAEE